MILVSKLIEVDNHHFPSPESGTQLVDIRPLVLFGAKYDPEFLLQGSIIIIVKPESEVQSPKIKTKRTWADTKITRLP